ncbi:MAG: hypothetical protein P9F19_05435 [Candidatus Contendobacter sp.]|jgi:hypothetical protein|nr:hypothetical protein [Candidatus Contendobacter sp.]
MNDGHFERVFADWQEHTCRELDRRVATAACLSFDRLRELSQGDGGEPSGAERRHLDKCRRCRGLRDGFQQAQPAQPFLADPGEG